jgi:hypothetical protein
MNQKELNELSMVSQGNEFAFVSLGRNNLLKSQLPMGMLCPAALVSFLNLSTNSF